MYGGQAGTMRHERVVQLDNSRRAWTVKFENGGGWTDRLDALRWESPSDWFSDLLRKSGKRSKT